MALIRYKDWRDGEPPKEYEEKRNKLIDKGTEVLNRALGKVNNLTEESLLEIKGIGKKTAQKILDGMPYSKIDELYEVVTPKIVAKIEHAINEVHLDTTEHLVESLSEEL